MTTLGIGAFTFPFFLIFGSLATVPLAGPPQPLDPAMSAIAPAECLWYATSAGTTEPDPNSSNQTEQLFAEPEVRYFSKSIQQQILRAVEQFAVAEGGQAEAKVLASEIPKLLQALMTSPIAGYVKDFQLAEDEVRVQAGLVLNARQQREQIEAAINALAELATANGAIIGSVERDGETWSIVRVSMQTPEVRWGWHNDYFILAVGDGTAETIIDRLTGSAPAWLDEIRSDLAVERESSLGYLNIELLLSRLQPLLEKEDGWQIVKKLGLTSIKSAYGRAGFDEQGCVSMSRLVTDGRRRGLLSLIPYKQLSDNDLKMIPNDAMLAGAVRVDISETWESLIRLVEEFNPRAVEQIDRGLRAAETELNVNIEDDLLGSLDDVWTAYLPAGDLMTSWLGSAVMAKVKDAERLEASIKQLVMVAQASLPDRNRNGVKIRETEFEGQTIYTVNVVGTPFPFSPTWCVTDDWLVLGLTPQTVRGVLTRQANESLADVVEVRESFGNSVAPSAIAYCDTPKLVRSLYPLVQMGAQMLGSQLQAEGIDLDTSILPSPDAIIHHLRPSVSVMAHRRDGYYFHSQHSLPGGGGAMVMAPVAVGLLLPAVQSARFAARQVEGINNMKYIALAVLNYESANGELPTNIYDDDGKAMLSWRVRILPYLEQQALYDRFHLDEPWDSPNNKPLSEVLVEQFSSPEGPADSRTRYLGLAGKRTIFPGNTATRFSQISDGTSNTIMIVCVEPRAAVPWSKPADLEFNEQKPFGSLENQLGYFLATMCDGSCHRIQLTIGEDQMRGLATRAGGELMDRGVLGR